MGREKDGKGKAFGLSGHFINIIAKAQKDRKPSNPDNIKNKRTKKET